MHFKQVDNCYAASYTICVEKKTNQQIVIELLLIIVLWYVKWHFFPTEFVKNVLKKCLAVVLEAFELPFRNYCAY